MKARKTFWATWLAVGIGVCGAWGEEPSPVRESAEPKPPVAALETAAPPVSAPGSNEQPAKLSSGLEEIVRMVQSGAGTNVVLSFIENSPVAYSPGADDVIALHKLGVPSSVIVALLQHGGRLRDQQMQAALTNRVPLMTAADWYASSNSQPQNNTETAIENPVFPVFTFSYPIWWFAGSPGFWFGYLWPYYNCGFVPRNSWCYVAPVNSRYPRGSWGSYSRTVNEPRGSYNPTPPANPAYIARPVGAPAPAPARVPRVNYPSSPSYRATPVAPPSPSQRGKGR